MIVLDSSAFFSMDVLPEEDHVCPPGVIKELEKYEDPRLALWGDMIRVSDCSKESLEKVEEAARKTGDIGRLSPWTRPWSPWRWTWAAPYGPTTTPSRTSRAHWGSVSSPWA